MPISLALIFFVAAVQANPVAVPQADTAVISPSAAPPPRCALSFSGSFGIIVQNVSTSAVAKRQEAATEVAEYMFLSPDVPIPLTMLR